MMAEYIYDASDDGTIVYVDDRVGVVGAKPHGGVIRCRDCRHFVTTPCHDGTTRVQCDGVFAFVEPNPSGFCAWAELADCCKSGKRVSQCVVPSKKGGKE